IIVSTQWDELRIPFSHMTREWTHDLRGYRLMLRENREGKLHINCAQRVEPDAAARPHDLTEAHHLFFFTSPSDRDDAWKLLVQRAAEIGADDMVGVEFDHARPSRVLGPFQLYVALGRMDDTDLRTKQLEAYAQWIPETDYRTREECLRYRALAHIMRDVGVVGTQEIGYPDKFAYLLRSASGWRRRQIY